MDNPCGWRSRLRSGSSYNVRVPTACCKKLVFRLASRLDIPSSRIAVEKSRLQCAGGPSRFVTCITCDNQDLIMHTMMSDGVATVSQTVFSTVISKLANSLRYHSNFLTEISSLS